MPFIVTPGWLNKKADFYFQLASYTNAGVPLIDALEMLSKGGSRTHRAELDAAVRRLKSGATFSEAMRSRSEWLPLFDLSMVEAGEQSGRLDAVFKMLGSYYQEQAVLARRILSDLAYPFFIVHLAIFVFPTSLLTGLLTAGGGERWLMNKVATLGFIYVLIIGSVLLANARFGKSWKELLGAIANAVPLLGKARRNLSLARFSGALEALTSAGVPVIGAWRMAGEASHSRAIRKAVDWALPRIQAGMTPGEAVRQLPVFPEMFQSLYNSGEISGQLDSSLGRLHRHYQEQASLQFQNFGQWMPRLIFLVVAVAIGYQIISFYTNYFGQLGGAI